ncbi:hypothetical protein F4779DRAFT_609537 [Xylariaceae sp. FL0662B]|nr:hypothetical protein F4779DRAFT_609537 [Xylariaceae sp. FL0662B]
MRMRSNPLARCHAAIYLVVATMDPRVTSRQASVVVYRGGYMTGSKTPAGNPAGLIACSGNDGDSGIVAVSINYGLGLFGRLNGGDATPDPRLCGQRIAFE